MQTRALPFEAATAVDVPSMWQGSSRAEWERDQAGLLNIGFGQPPQAGALRVTTTEMRPGYLRSNGVPYSADAVITEYFDVLHNPDGSDWLVVKTIVDDPTYLSEPFITSSSFRRERDRHGWNPQSCEDY
jgi:hypothetical protein